MRSLLFVASALFVVFSSTHCAAPAARPIAAEIPRAASKPAVANRDRHGPPDTAGYIARLEDASREGYLPTRRVVELLALKGDERVVDLGCGPGVVSAELARALPRGWVLAVDVEPAQLDRLNERLTKDGIDNVVPVLCTYESARIPPGFADRIVIVDTFHHFDDRVAYLRRLAAGLAPGGRVVNIDFKEGDLEFGPPASHKVAKATMLEEFAAAGFVVAAEVTEFRFHDFTVFERERGQKAP